VTTLHVVESFAEARSSLAMNGPIVLALCKGLSLLNGYQGSGCSPLDQVHVEAAVASVAPGRGDRIAWAIRGHFRHPAVWFVQVAMAVTLSQEPNGMDWETRVDHLDVLTSDEAAFKAIPSREGPLAAIHKALEACNGLGLGKVNRVQIDQLRHFYVSGAQPLAKEPVQGREYWATCALQVSWDTECRVGGTASINLRRMAGADLPEDGWEAEVLELKPKLVGANSDGVRLLKQSGSAMSSLQEALDAYNQHRAWELGTAPNVEVLSAEVDLVDTSLVVQWVVRLRYDHPASDIGQAEMGIHLIQVASNCSTYVRIW
jgi:hypothetical protein